MYYGYMIKTLPISKAREQLTSLVEGASKRLDEYVITVNGKPAAVLMSAAQFDFWKETDEIMNDPLLMKAIREAEEDEKKGLVEDWEDVKKELKIDVPDKTHSKS